MSRATTVSGAFAARIRDVRTGQASRVAAADLEAVRDFTDVRDIARGYVDLAERGVAGRVYNLCSGRPTTVGDVLDALLMAAGLDRSLVDVTANRCRCPRRPDRLPGGVTRAGAAGDRLGCNDRVGAECEGSVGGVGMTSWDGRHVLVTGAGGFIGSHLVEQLVAAGAQVRALTHYNSRSDPGMLTDVPADVRSAVEIMAGDITDPFLVRRAVSGVDTVFHLAALIAIPYSYAAPASYVSTNVTGTLNVLEAVRELEVPRMVHTSTSETYGTARYTPIDEKHPPQPQSPYSASKLGADFVAESSTARLAHR